MSEISDWFQNNWIDLARLLVQCAILAAVVRFGRQILAALRASQEQVGALLRLSVSDAVTERPAVAPGFEATRHAEAPAAAFAERERSREPEPEPEPEPVFAGAFSRGSGYAAEREQSLGGRVLGNVAPAAKTSYAAPTAAYSAPEYAAPAPASAYTAPAQRTESPSLTPWVSAPFTDPLNEPVRANLQAGVAAARPSVSTWLQAPMQKSSVSPWRKVVRWLQAPAGR